MSCHAALSIEHVCPAAALGFPSELRLEGASREEAVRTANALHSLLQVCFLLTGDAHGTSRSILTSVTGSRLCCVLQYSAVSATQPLARAEDKHVAA